MLIAIATTKKKPIYFLSAGVGQSFILQWRMTVVILKDKQETRQTNGRWDLLGLKIHFSFSFVFNFALNNFMLDILFKKCLSFFKYLQNWTYNMLAWKNQKTSRDTRRRASAALKPWWCGEELPSGSLCSWKVGPSIPRVTLWESNSH